MRFGEWGVKMDSKALENFIDVCIDLGLKDFDHADIYGHYSLESEFGEVLKRRRDLKQKIRITTKCGIKLVTKRRPSHRIKSYDSSFQHILKTVDNSLKSLQVDQIDVLLLHRPDYLMNPHEIANAFDQLKQNGKVKHFGVSNFTPSQFELLHSYSPLVTNQIEMSLLHLNALNDGTLDQCLKYRIHPTVWSPFGGGSIFEVSADPRIQRLQKKATTIANRYEATIDQILLAWLKKHPSGIIPIIGSSKIKRVKSALAGLDIQISHEEWYELLEASTGEEVA